MKNITYCVKDETIPVISNIIHELSEFLMHNVIFIKPFCNILNNIPFETIADNSFMKDLEIYIKSESDKLDCLGIQKMIRNKFTGYLTSYFCCFEDIKVTNFLKYHSKYKLKTSFGTSQKAITDEKKQCFVRIKGILFEGVVGDFLKTNYTKPNAKCSEGCKVLIDNILFKTEYHGIPRETIDFAGNIPSESIADFVECKISPFHIDEVVVSYAYGLKNAIETAGYSNVRVALASASSIHKIKKQVNDCLLNMGIPDNGLSYYGLGELYTLIFDVSMPA